MTDRVGIEKGYPIFYPLHLFVSFTAFYTETFELLKTLAFLLSVYTILQTWFNSNPGVTSR